MVPDWQNKFREMVGVSKDDTCDVDLRDPCWRVAPQGWYSEDELKPEKKKFKPSLDGGQHFHCITEKELDSLVVAKPPVNMEYSTKWVVQNFNNWMHQRNTTLSSESNAIPENLLESGSADQLCYWLSLYVVETCNKQGQPYPLKTI